MNTMLSIPSTISRDVSVTRASRLSVVRRCSMRVEVSGKPHLVLPYSFDTNDMHYHQGFHRFVTARDFTEYTTEDLNALVSTTISGFLYVSQLSVKQMLSQKSGSIVNVSSSHVDQPIAGVPATIPVMVRGSLHAVTRALAIEYAKDGIRVNTVALGSIKTPMHKPETYEFLNGLHPVGRMGELQEVVDAVLFLTEATFTTGEILHVDGGAHAGKW